MAATPCPTRGRPDEPQAADLALPGLRSPAAAGLGSQRLLQRWLPGEGEAVTFEQLSLLEPVADPPPGRAFAHGGSAPDRLLRALVRRGLEEDAWPAAAAIVLMLAPDAGGAERRGAR